MELENAIKSGSGGPSDQKIRELEERIKAGGGGGGNSQVNKQMEEMKARLAQTEAKLNSEKSSNMMMSNFLNQNGGLSDSQKDDEIENLKKTTGLTSLLSLSYPSYFPFVLMSYNIEMLMKRLESMTTDFTAQVDKLDQKITNIPVGMPGTGTTVRVCLTRRTMLLLLLMVFLNFRILVCLMQSFKRR